ncbi:efflux RND transporter permease subunit [bacterium]|nr:efflux RND transporter permease subunit [bacterium]
MLNALIRFSLRQRLFVISMATLLVALGLWQASVAKVDVFPDLNRPRVVIMTEAPGMAPEEVETLITLPIETAINGANGVKAVRSSSGVGMSVIYVEFDWGTDIYNDRQVISERLQLANSQLPPGIKPSIAPMSSIMGQVLMLGMWSEDGSTDPVELRTIADWMVRQRLLTVPGVSQVFTMGGGRKQFQVLIDPDAMLRLGVSLEQVKTAVQRSNQNATGGYLDEQGPNELLVRALGRIQSIDDLKKVVLTGDTGRPIALEQVASVIEGAEVKRGDSAAFKRIDDDRFAGGDAVILTINKQPDSDTRQLTRDVLDAINELKPSLPAGLQVTPLYMQKSFIDRAIENVIEAMRDGALLVVIILFAFLLNFRTTFITLVAIPLSILMTILVFTLFGLSINTMTLGGLAVAIGELVDDAIVDVENIFRRLRENQARSNPKPPILVVYQASVEIRNSIVFGTLIVTLVFAPLFALSGMEGRIFAPLGVAYIVSILCSLIVSLTVTPILSYWLLARRDGQQSGKDSRFLRLLKAIGEVIIRVSLRVPRLIFFGTIVLVLGASIVLSSIDRDFLPPFNEGAVQLNVILPPGTSLDTSNQIAHSIEQRLQEIEDVIQFGRRTGRAELDEHAEGVNMSEFIIELDPRSANSRESQLAEIRQAMLEIPGVVTAVEQPIAHLISHMLSGVKAQIGIKLYGDDLDTLRRGAVDFERAIKGIPGVTDLIVEPQVNVPQLRIELDRDRLLLNGLTVSVVNDLIETAMNGQVVSEIILGQRKHDLLLRFDERYRENLDSLRRLTISTESGGRIPLEAVAKIYESSGPNTINRENVRRRIVLQCNVVDRGVVDVVNEIQDELAPLAKKLPAGYFIEYSGQFESQQSAARMIVGLFSVAMLGVLLLLYSMFRSLNLALQILMALPMAFIGSVFALVITGQTLTIAAMVGFISLGGIASRNGILLVNHYLHLVRHEGESWSKEMIVRAGLERLAPVLMTAMTSGFGLIPLVLAAGVPGKEILYPIATVIVGGLISSTLLDFLVHPAMFWLFGIDEAKRVVGESQSQLVPELDS